MTDSREIRRSLSSGSIFVAVLYLAACSGNETSGDGTGGAPAFAGSGALGGASLGSGGVFSPMTGGSVATSGGSSAGGGSPNAGRAGGAQGGGGSGAASSSGGSETSGGSSGRGGALSGAGGKSAMSEGGAVSTTGGGSATAGAAGSGGAVTSAACGAGVEPLKSGRASLDVSGSKREYILKLPDDYDASRPHKLIFAFHARGGNASQVAGSGNNDYYGLVSRSDGSAIFVSPEGIDAGWRNENGRDIAFVKAMIEFFNSKLCIDQRRIFSTGFSFGGMMSDAIGCAMADVFRAIAPMAGAVPNPEHPYSGCDQVNMHPIAVWMSHGDNDTVVPLADGKDALAIFLKRSQCQAETKPVMPSPCVAYQGCLPDYPITFCQFSGGHGVPNFAADAIWKFFDQF